MINIDKMYAPIGGTVAPSENVQAPIAEPFSLDAKVWDKFFCATCQTERHISLRVRFGRNNMPRCSLCAARKTEPVYKSKAGRPVKVKDGYTNEDLEVQLERHIPDTVVEAYEESKWDY